MRLFLAIILGIVGGFFIGIALSSFLGVLGMMLFDTPIGIKYLPYFTAILFAFIVPVMDQKSRNSAS